MHVTGYLKKVSFTLDNKMLVTFEVVDVEKAKSEINQIKDGLCIIDADKFRNSKSAAANSYFWKLVQKLASVHGTTNLEMEVIELDKYGISEEITIPRSAYDGVVRCSMESIKIFKVMAESESFIQLRCYYGLHLYDSMQISKLLNGIIEDCHEMGISTITPTERQVMIKEWEKTKNERNAFKLQNTERIGS